MKKPEPEAFKEMSRRTFLKAVAAGGSILVLNGLELTRAQGGSIAEGDILVHAKGDKEGEPLLFSDLPEPEAFVDRPVILLHPMNPASGEVKMEQIDTLIAVRLDPAKVPESMVDYTTETGVVIYSAVCTHFACLVDRMNDKGLISCACHGSVYDPAAAAEPLDGPAPYALSMLPVEQTEDNTFVVTGEFNFPVETAT